MHPKVETQGIQNRPPIKQQNHSARSPHLQAVSTKNLHSKTEKNDVTPNGNRLHGSLRNTLQKQTLKPLPQNNPPPSASREPDASK